MTITTNSANATSTPRISFLALNDVGNTLFDSVVVIQDTLAVGLTANPDTIRLNSTSGSTASFSVSTALAWTTTDNDPWISSNPSTGTGSGLITVTANSDNPGNMERLSFVVVESSSTSDRDTVYVVQDTMLSGLATTPDTIRIGAASGSSASFDLVTSQNWTCLLYTSDAADD